MELQFIIIANNLLECLFSIPAGANIISKEMIIDSYVVIITIVELIFLQVSPHPLPLALCPLLYSHCPEIIIKGVKLLRPRTQGEVAKLDGMRYSQLLYILYRGRNAGGY